MNRVNVIDKKLKLDSNWGGIDLWLMHGKWQTLRNGGFADS